ncbi:hypothetical protein BKA82DRAFT_4134630 [Pisolithus tinctorius]|nr:hypothetical protein BKA82DRAFT_4134630 [Pisolithus tinctorius]
MRQAARSRPASVFRAFFAVLGRCLPTPSSAHNYHSLASSLPIFWNVMLLLFIPQVVERYLRSLLACTRPSPPVYHLSPRTSQPRMP